MVSEMTAEQKKRWDSEVKIMLKLDHLNVIKAYPIPEEFSGMTFEMQPLAMEYCVGGDLRKVGAKRTKYYGNKQLIIDSNKM